MTPGKAAYEAKISEIVELFDSAEGLVPKELSEAVRAVKESARRDLKRIGDWQL